MRGIVERQIYKSNGRKVLQEIATIWPQEFTVFTIHHSCFYFQLKVGLRYYPDTNATISSVVPKGTDAPSIHLLVVTPVACYTI